MSAATIRFEHIGSNPPIAVQPFEILLSEWRIERQATRARYAFLLGGRDSLTLGTSLRIELRWPWLDVSEADKLHAVMAAIRAGVEVRVRVFGTGHDSRFGFPHLNNSNQPLPAAERGLPVDLDVDDVGESGGDVLPRQEVEVTFITKLRLGAGGTVTPPPLNEIAPQ